MKPYYDHKGVTIYHGDCRAVSLEVKADSVLTDPPYGVNKAEWDAQFPEWCFDVCANMAPVFGIMPGVWNLPSCREKVAGNGAWIRYQWTLIAHLVNGMTNGRIGFGNYIPCLLYATDGVSVWKQDGDIKDFVVGMEPKQEHPSPKPLNVIKWFLSRLPGESVCDPFMGSGSTLEAAKALGRQAIGIEIEEKYCEIAAKRLSQEVLEFT